MKFEFNNLKKFSSFRDDRNYILLFHVDKIPPHLGLIQDNKYYSITVKEVEFGLSVTSILSLIKRKKIPTIIIETSKSVNSAARCFDAYSRLDSSVLSCLAPIKDVYSSELKNHVTAVELVFDLLELLEQREIIENYFELNLNCSTFAMQRYTMLELQQHISRLKNNLPLNA